MEHEETNLGKSFPNVRLSSIENLFRFGSIMEDFLKLAEELYCDNDSMHNLRQCELPFDRMLLINTAMSLRGVKQKFNIPKQLKDNTKSEVCRQVGNKLFSNKNWFEALEWYNKSICFAEKRSEHLAIGYANRSAIYFELKKYQLCLENIESAKNAEYPFRLMDKINRREVDCLSLLKENCVLEDYQQEREEPKLSFDFHPQLPFIVDCLELKETASQGRIIVTNKELKPGQIVSIENSFVHGTYEDVNYRRCTHCTKENFLSLIPCDFCTSAMFCSQNCMNEAANNFHEFECPMTDFLQMFKQLRFILRLVIRAIKSFSGTDEFELMEFIENTTKVTTFSFNHSIVLSPREQYHQVHSLITNENKRPEIDLLFRSMYTTLLYEQLLDHTNVKKMFLIDESEITKIALAELIDHSFLIFPQNAHFLSCFNGRVTENIGGAIYPLASLLNHSCSPNVFRISSGTRNIFVVLRNIKQNEQLLDCYTEENNSKYQTKVKRKQQIKDTLYFDCKCVACVKNFPLEIDYKKANIPLVKNGKSLRENMENCSKYLEKYDHKYPCVEVAMAQYILIRSMNNMYGNMSDQCKISDIRTLSG